MLIILCEHLCTLNCMSLLCEHLCTLHCIPLLFEHTCVNIYVSPIVYTLYCMRIILCEHLCTLHCMSLLYTHSIVCPCVITCVGVSVIIQDVPIYVLYKRMSVFSSLHFLHIVLEDQSEIS